MRDKERECSKCGGTISVSNTTGRCRSCAAKRRDTKKLMTGKCNYCGNPIATWNESGICTDCVYNNRNKKYKPDKDSKSLSSPGRKRHGMIQCFKCKKMFSGRQNQHPKYSLCSNCKVVNEGIISRCGWINGDAYTKGDRRRM